MSKIFKSIIALSFCLVFSAGCVGSLQQIAAPTSQSGPEIELPDRYFADSDTAPVDIKMVCAGILNQMRHRGATPFVQFDRAAVQKVQEKQFDYEGFDVTLIDITGFEADVVAKNKVRGVLEGVFHLEDYMGRRASTYFAAEYSKTPEGIFISKAGTAIIPPLYPRVEAYFVPVEALGRIPNGATYEDMYAFALENSLDMRPSGEEVQAYQEYQDLSVWKKLSQPGKTEERKLAAMVFSLDRLSNPSWFEVVVTVNNRKTTIEPGYVNENGWLISVAAGEFSPDNWSKALVEVNAFYTPEGNGKKLLVGKFVNQKEYDHAADARVEEKNEKGPVASGSVFLDPSERADARMIQQRLADLGYYSMAVDGLFGKGSQQAVQRFKKDRGLGDNPTWDIPTQKALFKESAL